MYLGAARARANVLPGAPGLPPPLGSHRARASRTAKAAPARTLSFFWIAPSAGGTHLPWSGNLGGTRRGSTRYGINSRPAADRTPTGRSAAGPQGPDGRRARGAGRDGAGGRRAARGLGRHRRPLRRHRGGGARHRATRRTTTPAGRAWPTTSPRSTAPPTATAPTGSTWRPPPTPRQHRRRRLRPRLDRGRAVVQVHRQRRHRRHLHASASGSGLALRDHRRAAHRQRAGHEPQRQRRRPGHRRLPDLDHGHRHRHPAGRAPRP